VSDALVAEGAELVALVERAGGALRLLGGAAVALHTTGAAHRTLGDLDAVTRREDVKLLTGVLAERGYEAESRFNALHGDRRLIFHGPQGKIDIFVDTFEMCHRIELGSRLELDSPTITVTDLLITKLQVVQLNAKDAHDLAVLLLEHELGAGVGDHIDLSYAGELVEDDWGLWRTLDGTLERLPELEPRTADVAGELRGRLDAVPKGRRFRLRSRVGERKRWYELPDDIE
jgi:putative nucleotidyltransferase-like protein